MSRIRDVCVLYSCFVFRTFYCKYSQYESSINLILLFSLFFFEVFVIWNWFNRLVKSIIYIIVIATFAISSNIFIFIIFFYYIIFCLFFYLKDINNTYFTNIQSLSQLYIVVTISSICFLYRNWLKSILFVRNCVNNVLCNFVQSLENCKYRYVIFKINSL